MSKTNPKAAAKIERLAQIAADLRAGENFNITRLTTIKSLASEPKPANRFVLHLAQKAEQEMQQKDCPKGLEDAVWEQAKTLAAEGVAEMPKYLKRHSQGREKTLRRCRTVIKKIQNEHRKVGWNLVRIIHSKELLMVEKALDCFLSPEQCGDWAYRIARDYAERYNPKYGTGLIPASAPFVEDIAEFWCQEYFGKSLAEEFGEE